MGTERLYLTDLPQATKVAVVTVKAAKATGDPVKLVAVVKPVARVRNDTALKGLTVVRQLGRRSLLPI
jgi:hypothetical protein